ncbi:BON domain-containing protein [Rheinheimera baltica]|uniref:BON domain-containing protein n=1 Tax=Rheinheimera baltica TaxID=67576 RepID=UPI0003FB32C1|nr:BON domain-containing protein [Rheinheimera baltica]MDP5143581.1 BON domain-containing protein [Rheinheimera baltica]MDP5151064.1 BON domain-containing protein [Rheinheimera baltica]
MKRTTLATIMTLALTTTAVTANDWQDSAKDAWIDGKAETTLLLNGNLNSFDINTDVQNGTITLTGVVESDVDKALAEELLENLDGVSSVDNKLTVKNHAKNADNSKTSALKDAKIATVVKTRLLFEAEVSGTAINVDAKDGVVTLQGKVDSAAEKDLAAAIAKNTDDVNRVVNKLDVAE